MGSRHRVFDPDGISLIVLAVLCLVQAVDQIGVPLSPLGIRRISYAQPAGLIAQESAGIPPVIRIEIAS